MASVGEEQPSFVVMEENGGEIGKGGGKGGGKREKNGVGEAYHSLVWVGGGGVTR